VKRDPLLDRLPGADELAALCENAKAVARLCELLGVGELEARESALLADLELDQGDDESTYIWDR